MVALDLGCVVSKGFPLGCEDGAEGTIVMALRVYVGEKGTSGSSGWGLWGCGW